MLHCTVCRNSPCGLVASPTTRSSSSSAPQCRYSWSLLTSTRRARKHAWTQHKPSFPHPSLSLSHPSLSLSLSPLTSPPSSPCRITRTLVFEKEQRLKETMRMMGLSTWIRTPRVPRVLVLIIPVSPCPCCRLGGLVYQVLPVPFRLHSHHHHYILGWYLASRSTPNSILYRHLSSCVVHVDCQFFSVFR